MRRLAVGLLVLLVSTTYALDIGDKAPSIEAETWINGDAVNPAEPDGKTTYVVEFWATWCSPCKRTIPHLNKLQDTYRDRGVVMVGVTAEPEETVRKFFKEKLAIEYLVALAPNREAQQAWMEGVPGIPHAFLVDTNGIVVWSGHPMDGLDAVLDQVLAGSYDLEAARRVSQQEARMQKLLMEGKMAEALEQLDELIASDPRNSNYYRMKMAILMQESRLDEVKAVYQEIYKAFPDSAEELNTLAWMAITSPFPLRDPELAWRAARRAVDVSERGESAILDTLARVYYELGLVDEAIPVQAEAVAKAEEDDREDLEATLAYYRAIAQARGRIDEELRGGAEEADAP